MSRQIAAGLLPLVALVTMLTTGLTAGFTPGRVSAAETITAEKVDQSIERAIKYLKSKQIQSSGAWPNSKTGTLQPGGTTALVTLAMINAGVPVKDPAIQKALANLRSLGKPTLTYSTSLQTMVLCAAEPDKDMALIRRNAAYLQEIQIKGGNPQFVGTWGYSDHQGNGDNSNTQFALLALYEAQRAGVEIRDDYWVRAYRHWAETQRPEGSWGYFAGQGGTGSMTCAGITSVLITTNGMSPTAAKEFGIVTAESAKVDGAGVQCCGATRENQVLQNALAWLAAKFTVKGNPAADQLYRQQWIFYYLYGVERVGRLTGQRFIGRHDWYREGSEFIASRQDSLTGSFRGGAGEDDLVATSLGLLFLSKGRRPVLVAQLKHNPPGDWNYHRKGIANLTHYVEQAWKRDLTWQVIDPRAATAEDLLQAPVLYLSGRDGIEFNADEKENLKTYINQGGFLFVENCCKGEGFDRDFRKLMSELFPDSQLRQLGPDHPVWFAEEKVDPDHLRDIDLWGLDACCRTSVVYCPTGNLSCYWDLSGDGRKLNYPKNILADIAACNSVGVNVMAYATGRQLRNKLDIPQVIRSEKVGPPRRGTLQVAKLRHNGGSDEAQAALVNLLAAARQQTDVPISSERRLLSITDPQLMEHPVVFMHGRRGFSLTAEQRQALKTYLERGGFLFADSICANRAFAQSFRRELKLMFPTIELQPVPADDPLLSKEYRGYDLSSVTMRDPQARVEGDPIKARLYKTAPQIEALSLEGRYSVIFSPYDISCALENSPSLECKGYIRADAARLGTNILLYALQQ